MYETYPKFSLGFAAVMLVAAFVLPAVTMFPFSGEIAAGFQIAMLLWVLWVVRSILLPDQSSWLDAARFPLTLIAAAAALNFSPQDGAVDILTRTGFLAILVVPATGLALLSRRPNFFGFSVNRQFWSVLVAILFLALVNHFFWFPESQAAAVVADLVALAGLANWAVVGQAPSNGNLGQRALNVLSLTLCIGTVSWMVRPLADGPYDAVTSVVPFLVQFVMFWLFYPSIERLMLKR